MATKNLVPRNSGEGSLGSSSKPWASGYYDKLYITGAAGWAQITGGGGGGGDSSPLTTKGDIWGYTSDNARIPVGVNGQILVAESTEAAGVKWGNSGSAAGSSLWTQNGSDINYTAGNVGIGISNPQYLLAVSGTPNTVLAKFEGDVHIGGDSADNATLTVAHTGSIGGIATPLWSQAAILVSGGSGAGVAANGLLAIDNNSIWMAATGAGQIGAIGCTSGDMVMGSRSGYNIRTDGTNVGIGNLGAAATPAFNYAYPLHVSGTANAVVAKFEGDVNVGGDSTDNATLTVRHSGTIGHAPALSDYKNAAILITGYHPSHATPAILALDQNQMSYSSGQFNITAGSVGGDGGGSITLSSTPPNKAPSTDDKTLKVFNSGVGIAANATSEAQFASNPNFPAYPLHVSGTPNTVMAKFEGDVDIGGDGPGSATLRIRHSGTIGSSYAPNWQNSAILINANELAADSLHPYVALGLDNNQVMFSGGASMIANDTGHAWPVMGSGPWYGPGSGPSRAYNSDVSNVKGPLTLGSSTYSGNPANPVDKPAGTPFTNIRLADRRVGLGTAGSFSAACTLHVSGGLTGADGGIARFEGDTHVEGELTATTKTFLIDHPSQPGKILRHGCLEGPEHGVYSRGTLVNNNIIALPDYWVDLVDESTITCQLTAQGSYQQLYVDSIGSNQIKVGSDQAQVYCHYLAQAERKDVDKITVEQ